MNRVVVTGLGVLSPVGSSLDKYWAALLAGRSGFGPHALSPADRISTKVVAPVTDFVASEHFDARELSYLDRVSQFAVIAAREAVQQSGLSFGRALGGQTAAIVGTAVGGQTTADDNFRRFYTEVAPRFHPMTIPKAMASAPPSHISMLLGITGPTFAISSACASATHAIGLAFQMIRCGSVTCALAGGTDACITLGTLKGWEALRILAPDTCRPFSVDRKGMVIGEGAAILTLESLDHAAGRGVRSSPRLQASG